MALQTSGAISLNDIHEEAGGSRGTQSSLNDSDIRDLIGKGSGVQTSFSEYYGAAATDAVETESFGSSWGIGFFGYSTGTNLDTPIFTGFSGNPGSALNYPHAWPCAADGLPHAFTSDYPAVIKSYHSSPGTGQDYSALLPPQFDTSTSDGSFLYPSNWQKYGPDGLISATANTNNINNPGVFHTRTFVAPLQRVKTGNRTFNGYTQDDGFGGGSRYQNVSTYLVQYENMTPHSSGLYATAGGNRIKTQLGASVTGQSQTRNFSQVVNVQYEWCFIFLTSSTASYESRTHTGGCTSIT